MVALFNMSFGFGAVVELPREKLPGNAGLPQLLGRSGAFEIRLSTARKEIRAAQRLRYRVFYEQGRAVGARTAAMIKRDLCPFDKFCDHLLVLDTAGQKSFGCTKPKVVGTYRLLRGEVAARRGGFYSEGEFDLAPLLARHQDKRFLEVGRSCVHPDYRSKRVIELLWRGLWIYAKHHKIGVMIGCASLPGNNPLALALPLSFLRHQAAADPEWQVRPREGCAFPMPLLDKAAVDKRKGIAALPPLIKAYLRLGAKFADGAVLDRSFGTIDVFTVLPVSDIEERYIAYFGAPGDAHERKAA